MRLRLIRFLGLEAFFLRLAYGLDRTLRHWPWLYRKLGGDQ